MFLETPFTPDVSIESLVISYSGTLHVGFSPARTATSPHFTSKQEWPWQWFPQFLGREIVVFSQDTIPFILHAATRVPLFKHSEVWLTGLVRLAAKVIRVGVRDQFVRYSTDERLKDKSECYWSDRVAVWGLGREEEEWMIKLKKSLC
eukprot:TRINITY_DN79364_c0_g1_i1.p1 TRINITY_DN79364_c0_g1~~TRINITY_DN79364_c0_g1_i1.p1  ORF type:complete len:148 (-),score=10.29 TRINITY_DN79364_c0_g1_i1:34-477(-)